jgi:hypothetical protein
MEPETLHQRSNSYSRDNRTVGSGVFLCGSLRHEKAKMIADCLENQLISHDIYDENQELGWTLESKICSRL